VVREAAAVRRAIALAGQSATVDDDLTGRENLVFLGRLAGLRRAAARARAAELLAPFGLEHAVGMQVKTYSGGMRRRLDLAASLIIAAELYFLDEPTTGLDPASRAQVYQLIRSLAPDGSTVLLTTHYLDEADQLASRIAVMDRGIVVAEGTPGELKAAAGTGTLRIRLADPAQRSRAARLLIPLFGEPALAEADPVMLAVSIPAGRSGRAPGEQAADAIANHATYFDEPARIVAGGNCRTPNGRGTRPLRQPHPGPTAPGESGSLASPAGDDQRVSGIRRTAGMRACASKGRRR